MHLPYFHFPVSIDSSRIRAWVFLLRQKENKISFYFFLKSIKARAMEKRGYIHRPEGGQATLRKKKRLKPFPSKHAPRYVPRGLGRLSSTWAY